jgi:hypothetical protein
METMRVQRYNLFSYKQPFAYFYFIRMTENPVYNFNRTEELQIPSHMPTAAANKENDVVYRRLSGERPEFWIAYNDVNLFCLIIKVLDCFAILVRTSDTLVIANPSATLGRLREAIQTV